MLLDMALKIEQRLPLSSAIRAAATSRSVFDASDTFKRSLQVSQFLEKTS